MRYLRAKIMRLFSIIMFLVLSYAISAQRTFGLQVVCADKPTAFLAEKFRYKTLHKDSSEAFTELSKLILRLKNNGYLAVSADSIFADSVSVKGHIYVGEKFDELLLRSGNIEATLLAESNTKQKLTAQNPVSFTEASTIKEKILRSCENNGYPFAAIRLDSIAPKGTLYEAALNLEKNDLIRIDTLSINGKTKVKRLFLRSYLGIKTGKPYNEANIRRITQRINELQFVESIQPHQVEFQNGKATINLYLRDRKASQFNFLLGLLPGSSGQKLLVTGEARFHLFSLLGLGEEFFIEWQKLQPKTQRLDARVSFPYLAGLPLGINAKFELYKRDTTYIDLDGDYGIRYQLLGSNYVQASYKQRSTIILNVDTALIKTTRTLPANLDVSSNEFALEYFVQQLNYRFNPVSGFVFRLNTSAGVKQIKKSNTISSLKDEVSGNTFGMLYDTVRLKSFQFRLGLAIDKYWKLANRHTIKTNLDVRYFFSRRVFANEMFRLGGTNSLRGFDDQSIFTPYYIMANVEYRFLLSKNSYFGAFFNCAMVKDIRFATFKNDFPFGFGVTGAIETKAGIFGITYAMGRQLGNKLTFNDSKIHIGYINYF